MDDTEHTPEGAFAAAEKAVADANALVAELRAENGRLRDELARLTLEIASWRGTLTWPPKEERDEFRIAYTIRPPEEPSG